MKSTNKIELDSFAFYVGGTDTCLSCKFRKEEVLKLEPIAQGITFYEMDANLVEGIIKKYQISKIPFFIFSKNGKVIDLFYDYRNVTELYIRLWKNKEKEYDR